MTTAVHGNTSIVTLIIGLVPRIHILLLHTRRGWPGQRPGHDAERPFDCRELGERRLLRLRFDALLEAEEPTRVEVEHFLLVLFG